MSKLEIFERAKTGIHHAVENFRTTSAEPLSRDRSSLKELEIVHEVFYPTSPDLSPKEREANEDHLIGFRMFHGDNLMQNVKFSNPVDELAAYEKFRAEQKASENK